MIKSFFLCIVKSAASREVIIANARMIGELIVSGYKINKIWLGYTDLA